MAPNAERQVKKRRSQQKDLSCVLNPLTASWGAKTSAVSIAPTESQGVGGGLRAVQSVAVRLNECCAPTRTEEKMGWCPQENSLFWGKRVEWKGNSPEYLSKTEVAVEEIQYRLTKQRVTSLQSRGHSPSSAKDGIVEFLTAHVTCHFKHLWYWRTECWHIFKFFLKIAGNYVPVSLTIAESRDYNEVQSQRAPG